MLDLKDVWTDYKRTGDPAIREQIILDCMPLVKYVVGKFASSAPRHCDREDLIQCGIFGLIDAIERYDPGKDVKFETYAILRIRGAVMDELRSRDWVPRAKRKMAREVRTITCELESRDGSIPTTADLARVFGISDEQMEQMLQHVSVVSFVSIDESRGTQSDDNHGTDTRVADLLADTHVAEPSSAIELGERLRALARCIAELPEQERVIVTLHYYEDIHLKDIGDIYGVSESRISQVHSRALVLLRLKMQELLGE